MQRHLAAFKSTLLAASRTGPHALVSASGRFSMSRTGTAANAFCFVCRPRIRPECIDARHKLLLQNPQQMRNFCDHSSNCRSIFSLANGIQLSQPEALHNQLLVFGETDRTSV